MLLQMIHNENRECIRCSLRAGCSQVVPGVGPEHARLVIIGEAPGADEDIEGIPFFGRCGKLLTKLLRCATIEREECYITNVVCCRPTDNATPTDYEVSACKSWLWRKLELIQPNVVITLGKTPTRLLLKTKKTITLREFVGKPFQTEYLKATIYPYYHPSFLLQHGRRFEQDAVEFFKRIKLSLQN